MSSIKKDELPQELQNKSTEGNKEHHHPKGKGREQLSKKEIAELAIKRQAYIEEQLKKKEGDDSGDDLGKAITSSILTFANLKGYTVEAE